MTEAQKFSKKRKFSVDEYQNFVQRATSLDDYRYVLRAIMASKTSTDATQIAKTTGYKIDRVQSILEDLAEHGCIDRRK